MRTWKGFAPQSVEDYSMCFACGQENPNGLKLRFRKEGETVKTEFTPGECHQGWPGIVHGGIIETLLDEAMCYAPFLFHGMYCVTAKIEVRIRQPVPAGQRLLISSNVVRKTRKLVETEANIILEDGSPVAEGKATMYVVSESKKGM